MRGQLPTAWMDGVRTRFFHHPTCVSHRERLMEISVSPAFDFFHRTRDLIFPRLLFQSGLGVEGRVASVPPKKELTMMESVLTPFKVTSTHVPSRSLRCAESYRDRVRLCSHRFPFVWRYSLPLGNFPDRRRVHCRQGCAHAKDGSEHRR